MPDRLKLILWLSGLLIVAAACSGNPVATETPAPPTLTPTLVPTPSPVPTLQEIIIATDTPAPTPTSDVVVIPITVEPLLGEEVIPPITIDLPEGWQVGYDAFTHYDIDTFRSTPFAFYTGPVTGGQGFIILLWGFPNFTSPFEGQIDLFRDGLRLLRGPIVEWGCNVGTDLRREFSVGGLPAAGTYFQAVDCPSGLEDTRGWFAGLNVDGLNFVFYTYTWPITAMDGAAQAELQEILDSVKFNIVIPEATAEAGE